MEEPVGCSAERGWARSAWSAEDVQSVYSYLSPGPSQWYHVVASCTSAWFNDKLCPHILQQKEYGALSGRCKFTSYTYTISVHTRHFQEFVAISVQLWQIKYDENMTATEPVFTAVAIFLFRDKRPNPQHWEKCINICRDRPNFVFVTENEDFDWFRPVSFSDENAFHCFRIFLFSAENVHLDSQQSIWQRALKRIK